MIGVHYLLEGVNRPFIWAQIFPWEWVWRSNFKEMTFNFSMMGFILMSLPFSIVAVFLALCLWTIFLVRRLNVYLEIQRRCNEFSQFSMNSVAPRNSRCAMARFYDFIWAKVIIQHWRVETGAFFSDDLFCIAKYIGQSGLIWTMCSLDTEYIRCSLSWDDTVNLFDHILNSKFCFVQSF